MKRNQLKSTYRDRGALLGCALLLATSTGTAAHATSQAPPAASSASADPTTPPAASDQPDDAAAEPASPDDAKSPKLDEGAQNTTDANDAPGGDTEVVGAGVRDLEVHDADVTDGEATDGEAPDANADKSKPEGEESLEDDRASRRGETPPVHDAALPRSDPWLSVGAGAGACAATTCLPPLLFLGCTGAGIGVALTALGASPVGLAAAVGLPCAGLSSGVCLAGPGGAVATTAASAGVAYSDQDEDGAYDAIIGGIPALGVGMLALLILPVTLLFGAGATVLAANSLTGDPAVLAQVALIVLVPFLPLILMPSLLLALAAPCMGFVGTSAARIHFASTGPPPIAEGVPSRPRRVSLHRPTSMKF